MDTQMHAIHFKADKKLLSFIQERLNKLEQFNDAALTTTKYFHNFLTEKKIN